jgi:hypothetical protein
MLRQEMPSGSGHGFGAAAKPGGRQRRLFSVGLLPWKKRMCSDAFYVFVISDQAA